MNNIAEAMVNIQKEIGSAVKSSNNPFFKSKYADLSEIITCYQELASKYKIAVVQCPVFRDGRVGVITKLIHVSGEYLESELTLPLVKQDPQSCGSAITYARRYALAAMFGIKQEDDDGERAMDRSKEHSSEKKETSDKENNREYLIRQLIDIAVNKGWTKEEVSQYAGDKYGVNKLTELDAIKFADVYKKFSTKKP